jgi:hypothetical protein
MKDFMNINISQTFKYWPGEVLAPDGEELAPDGEVLAPDGAVLAPDGEVLL